MNASSKGKVVVAGGAGFIGAHLSEALVKEGYDVHIVDTLKNGKRENVPEGATLHETNVLDTPALTSIFQGAQTVFHTAALPRVPFSVEHPFESHETNVDGTLSMLIAARDAKVGRVIYSASGSAYGTQDVLPLVETLPAHPANPYGLQKYIGELYTRMFWDVYGLPTVSLRYFNVYGPGLDPEGPYALAIGRFVMARKKNEPITIFGDGTVTRDFTHVRDVVRANILAAKSTKVGKGEVINIGAGRNISIQKLAEMFGGEIVYGPPRIEAHDSQADIRKAKELLGWEPEVTLEEGIAELKKEFGVA